MKAAYSRELLATLYRQLYTIRVFETRCVQLYRQGLMRLWTDVRPVAGADYEVVPVSRMRQRAAERLTRSKQTIPHFYLSQDVDMTAAQAWRQSQLQPEACI